jgi:hypothetical protein
MTALTRIALRWLDVPDLGPDENPVTWREVAAAGFLSAVALYLIVGLFA